MNVNCSSGTVTNNPQQASRDVPAEFIIEGYLPNTICAATEVGVPEGYSKDEADCQDGDSVGSSCTIVNTLNTGTFKVKKVFSDDSTNSVSVSATCTSGVVTNNPQSASRNSPAMFEIEGYSPGATCTATEGNRPLGIQEE